MKALTTILVTFLLIAPTLAQDWTKTTKILIQPGKAAGAIELGKPVPANASSLYGKPTSRTEPSPGADGQDTGSLVYGSTAGYEIRAGLLVKLNDGKGDQNVYSVYVSGVRAYTAQGATLGQSYKKARAIYPQAEEGNDAMSGDQTLQIPGLTMIFANGIMVGMAVRSTMP